MFRDPEELCEIQDVGLRVRDSPHCQRYGCLRDLLDHKDDRVLNALQNPLPSRSINLPPAWSAFATHEHAFTQLAGIDGVPRTMLPWGDVCWAVICTAGANTLLHVDLYGTYFEVTVGEKIFFLGRRRDDFEEGDHKGDWASRHAFSSWDPTDSNTNTMRFEVFILRPGQVLYMQPGVPHYVISTENSIAVGGHDHCASSMQRSVYTTYANVMAARSTTNADHVSSRYMFLRIFRFQLGAILKGKSGDIHVFDLAMQEGILDFLALHHLVILYQALHPASYYQGEANALGARNPETILTHGEFSEFITCRNHAVQFYESVDEMFRVICGGKQPEGPAPALYVPPG
ncbi:hypothetical protein B0H10DRAFT_1969610 [Mycena sp. CBHHK59/15]|nr:hypothetical protein B0H10DRAFT_1969610 [Mycena sp. CBHHK59/15]